MKGVLAIGILLFLTSCSTELNEEQYSEKFKELSPEQHGIDFVNALLFTPEINIIEYLYFNNGGGVAIGDLDNDGLEDIFLTANQGPDKLYRNLGDLQFEDISLDAGISQLENWSTGVCIDDVNGDGWNDIYVSKVAPVSRIPTHNELYINQRDGTFKEMSIDYGLDFSGYGTQASFFDYDMDGDLDVYLLNHSVHSIRSYGNISLREERSELSGDRIYENRLNEDEGMFVDVTQSTGIYSSALGYGLGVITSDMNGDGLIDIYVGNDFHENDYLYINNGDKTFTESIHSQMTQSSQYTMGVDVADINGDGYKDMFSTDMMPYDAQIKMRSGGNDTKQVADIKQKYGFLTQYSRNHMQIYRPSLDAYTEEALISQVFASDWSWSVLLQDFDNSGTTDIYIANGIVNRPNDLDYINYINTPSNRQKEGESNGAYNQRLISQMPTLKIPNLLFSQYGNGVFSDIDESKLGSPNYSNGAAYADLDLDGDLDIVCNNVNGSISLMENQSTANHFISIATSIKNTSITIYYDDVEQTKEYLTTRGFQSSSSHYVHFGLGTESVQLDSIVIRSPNGSKQRFVDIDSDQYIELEIVRSQPSVSSIANLVTNHDLEELPTEARENDFDDLDREPLSPIYMSRLGLAAVPIHLGSDETPTLFIGGGSGSKAQLWRYNSKSPTIKWNKLSDLNDDPIYVDVDAAEIDFNRDGFNDLYVVSGGNQFAQLDPNNQDRLFINDGKGSLTRVPISLPHMNGSTVSVGDFDTDGYEDIFVGSASVPGGYGDSPMSFILKNVGGQGIEIAYKDKLGMITDSKWVNIDQDEAPELIVVGHWMAPIILDYGSDGSFVDVSDDYLPPNLEGMYNCIELADINQDGQVDFLLGNIGSNTNWNTGDDQGLELYLADFDQNGSLDPIVFNYYFGSFLPFLDKTTIQSQVPSIRRSFHSYKDYSSVSSIQQLFPNLEEGIFYTKRMSNLESIALVSSSDEHYEVFSLPREMQLTTINDMLFIDTLGTVFYGSNSDAYSHELGEAMSHGAGSVKFTMEHTDSIRMDHKFINVPIGSVVREVVELDENQLILFTKDKAISYKIQ